MIRSRLGSTVSSIAIGLVALVGVGAGSYSLITGNTLCSMVGSCDTGDVAVQAVADGKVGTECSTAKAYMVANAMTSECSANKGAEVTEVALAEKSGEAKSCCPLTAVAAKKSSCEKSNDVVTTNVALKDGEASSCSTKSSCGDKVSIIATEASAKSCETASSCHKAEVTQASLASEGCSVETKSCSKSVTTVAIAEDGSCSMKTKSCEAETVSVQQAALATESCESAKSCSKGEVIATNASVKSCETASSCNKAQVTQAALATESCESAKSCDKGEIIATNASVKSCDSASSCSKAQVTQAALATESCESAKSCDKGEIIATNASVKSCESASSCSKARVTQAALATESCESAKSCNVEAKSCDKDAKVTEAALKSEAKGCCASASKAQALTTFETHMMAAQGKNCGGEKAASCSTTEVANCSSKSSCGSNEVIAATPSRFSFLFASGGTPVATPVFYDADNNVVASCKGEVPSNVALTSGGCSSVQKASLNAGKVCPVTGVADGAGDCSVKDGVQVQNAALANEAKSCSAKNASSCSASKTECSATQVVVTEAAMDCSSEMECSGDMEACGDACIVEAGEGACCNETAKAETVPAKNADG